MDRLSRNAETFQVDCLFLPRRPAVAMTKSILQQRANTFTQTYGYLIRPVYNVILTNTDAVGLHNFRLGVFPPAVHVAAIVKVIAVTTKT